MIQNSLHSLIFKKVISKPSFQLPYYLLDMEDRDYLRMRSQLYGYSFNKNYRKYNLWFTMGLKKNINILAPFFFEFSSYHTFDTINSKTWDQTAYTLVNSYFPLTQVVSQNLFHSWNSENLSDYLYDVGFEKNWMHKSNKLISKGIDYSISIYDSIVNQDFQFKYKITKDYFIFSNSHFESSFFINSYDTTRLLYPQLFFEYNYFSYKLQKYINYNNFFKTYSIVTYFYIFIYINFKNLIYVTYKKKLNKYIKLSTNKNLLLFYYLSATSKYLGTKMANIKQEDYIFFSEIANNTLPKSLSKALKLKTKKKSKSYKKLLRIIAKKASFFKRSKLIKKDVIINSNSLNIYHNSRVMDACVYSSKIDRSFIFTKFLSKTVYAYPETGTNQTYKILRSLGKLINFPRLPIFLKNDLEAYKTEHLREGEITYEIRPAKPKNNKNTVLRYSNEVKGISYLKHHWKWGKHMGNFLMRFADVFVKSIKTMFAQWIDLSAHSMDINSIISLTFIYKYFDLYRGYVKAFFKFRFRRKRRKFKWAHKYYNNKLRSRKFTPALFMFYLNTKQLLLYKKEKGVKPWKMRRRYIVKSICKNIKTKKLRKYILCRMLS